MWLGPALSGHARHTHALAQRSPQRRKRPLLNAPRFRAITQPHFPARNAQAHEDKRRAGGSRIAASSACIPGGCGVKIRSLHSHLLGCLTGFPICAKRFGNDASERRRPATAPHISASGKRSPAFARRPAAFQVRNLALRKRDAAFPRRKSASGKRGLASGRRDPASERRNCQIGLRDCKIGPRRRRFMGRSLFLGRLLPGHDSLDRSNYVPVVAALSLGLQECAPSRRFPGVGFGTAGLGVGGARQLSGGHRAKGGDRPAFLTPRTVSAFFTSQFLCSQL